MTEIWDKSAQNARTAGFGKNTGKTPSEVERIVAGVGGEDTRAIGEVTELKTLVN